jgi:fructose-1-phosphate kinase PfkB-like protein
MAARFAFFGPRKKKGASIHASGTTRFCFQLVKRQNQAAINFSGLRLGSHSGRADQQQAIFRRMA